MKYIVVLGDGMADRPLEELGNKTPLEYARTPVMDALASKGEIGMVHTIPEGMKRAVIRRICLYWVMIRGNIIPDDPRWRL